jgi:hypothetical protein
MNDQSKTLKDAEAFVRKALAHVSDAPVDERTVKAVAMKVSKAVPSYGRLRARYVRAEAADL